MKPMKPIKRSDKTTQRVFDLLQPAFRVIAIDLAQEAAKEINHKEINRIAEAAEANQTKKGNS